MDIRRIYVAEDNPLQTELMKSVLEVIERCEVTFYPDGLEIYQAVQENKPDLLILDIILPTLTGLAISRLVKFSDMYKHIPVIVSSSIIDSDIKERAKYAGADDFLPKPYPVADLLDMVNRFLPG